MRHEARVLRRLRFDWRPGLPRRPSILKRWRSQLRERKPRRGAAPGPPPFRLRAASQSQIDEHGQRLIWLPRDVLDPSFGRTVSGTIHG